MKHLIKRFLDGGISRRSFLSALGALGINTMAARSMALSLAPFQRAEGDPGTENSPSWIREVRGTGGALLVAQLKAAGVQYIFFNPSSGEAPFFDALVDEPDLHPIKALQEGALAAMADGYAKASGKTPFVLLAHPGLPNAMTQMFNTWKDQIPLVVAAGYSNVDALGQDGFEAADHMEEIPAPITKWHWMVETAEKIPETTRRAFKFASTAPCGPVFVAYPENLLEEQSKALIMDQAKFNLPMKIRPDPAAVEQAARLLLEAKNPLVYVGDEIVWCGAQKEVIELAELLGLPVTRSASIGWSKPFPTRHPLYLGDYLARMRYPGAVDMMLNLGSRMPYPGSRLATFANLKLIQIRLDPTNLAREYATDVPIFADLKLAITDLVAALRSMATASRLQQIGDARRAKSQEFTAKLREFRSGIARQRWDNSPISNERVGAELEQVLDKDTCVVTEIGSGSTIDRMMYFGGGDKSYFSNSGKALGWGVPASFGIKLAQPDLPVVAVVGDGAFLFSGPQPLWSFARYRAPVTIIVQNNGSYNDERNRMFYKGGRQFQTGRDMACYLGDPDVDFVKAAKAFGVEGEAVTEPAALRPALERSKRATAQGSPYLLDVHVERNGVGGASDWHPSFSIKALRKREV